MPAASERGACVWVPALNDGDELPITFDDLHDKICVLTGGAGVIGRTLVSGLASVGVRTAILDLDQDAAREIVSIAQFFDEPFENMDEMGAQSVMNLLHSQSEKFETILVVTHNEFFKNQFDKELQMVKENGISTLGV